MYTRANCFMISSIPSFTQLEKTWARLWLSRWLFPSAPSSTLVPIPNATNLRIPGTLDSGVQAEIVNFCGWVGAEKVEQPECRTKGTLLHSHSGFCTIGDRLSPELDFHQGQGRALVRSPLSRRSPFVRVLYIEKDTGGDSVDMDPDIWVNA